MSERRTEANRLNAKKSTGPRTPEGKARSSMNAVKHGILAHARLLPDESREAYSALLDSWMERLQPLDTTEIRAVEDIVTIEWHILRIRNIESDLLHTEYSNPILDEGFAQLDGNYRVAVAFQHLSANSGALHLANRQLGRLSRELNRRLKMFLELREKCPPPPAAGPLPAVQPVPAPPERKEVQIEPIDVMQFWRPPAREGRFEHDKTPAPQPPLRLAA